MGDDEGPIGPEWSEVDHILESVSEVAKEDREGLLNDLCRDDRELRAEVESLLEHIAPGEMMLASLSQTLGGASGPSSPKEAEPEKAHEYVGHYRLVRKLPGGMSQVYEAWDEKAERRVVVKLAREERDARARERLAREARADATLQHPNVCRILDVGFTPEDRPYLVFEFCPGATLAELQKQGPISQRLAVSVAMQTAEALSEAHGLGIVHRDIKPENLIVDDGGRVKLLDFGTAQEGQERLTGPGMIVGTPLYMSPEQLTGETVGSATDIWSLGVVLFECLKGVHPFHGASRRRTLMNIAHLPAPLLDEADGVSEGLGKVVAQALSRDPGDRPDASALAAALARAQEP